MGKEKTCLDCPLFCPEGCEIHRVHAGWRPLSWEDGKSTFPCDTGKTLMAYDSLTAELRAEVEGHKREARAARVAMAHAMGRAGKLEQERDKLLKALEPFAKAGVMMDRDSDVLYVTYIEGPLAAEKYFETARKVVRELKDDGE